MQAQSPVSESAITREWNSVQESILSCVIASNYYNTKVRKVLFYKVVVKRNTLVLKVGVNIECMKHLSK